MAEARFFSDFYTASDCHGKDGNNATGSNWSTYIVFSAPGNQKKVEPIWVSSEWASICVGRWGGDLEYGDIYRTLFSLSKICLYKGTNNWCNTQVVSQAPFHDESVLLAMDLEWLLVFFLLFSSSEMFWTGLSWTQHTLFHFFFACTSPMHRYLAYLRCKSIRSTTNKNVAR